MSKPKDKAQQMRECVQVLATDAELVVEASTLCEALGMDAQPQLVDSIDALGAQLPGDAVVLTLEPPSLDTLSRLARKLRASKDTVVFAFVGSSADHADALALAGDAGLVACEDVGAALASYRLRKANAHAPWAASTRALSPLDRARFAWSAQDDDAKASGAFVRAAQNLIAWRQDDTTVALGGPRDVASACAALLAAESDGAAQLPTLPTNAARDTREVLFGPARALSDPASKAALRPYGLAFPEEELCASPSRASTEATRLGFPVRIALASPDLRVWDHPDLAIEGVMNAAQVRDVFRQLTMLAEARDPAARVLGVTVTAATQASALLWMSAEPLGEDDVLARIGFADAHGLASGDATLTVLPATQARIERALGRLLGSALLFGGSTAVKRATTTSLTELIAYLGAFTHTHREHVEQVELRPVAVLVGGAIEVREACVSVSDGFSRDLDDAIR